MTNDDGRKPEGAPERSPKADVGARLGIDGNGPKRFSVQRKMAIVARLLRGEPLELVARRRVVRLPVLSLRNSMKSSFRACASGRDGVAGGCELVHEARPRHHRPTRLNTVLRSMPPPTCPGRMALRLPCG
jgi:hypothetical protein